MKKLPILLTLSILVLISCKGTNSYTMETTYKETKNNGDSAMNIKKETISADTDSLAYIKAQQQFNELSGKSNNDGVPVSFLVKNGKGAVVPGPGLDSSLEKEKNMYPNQKSPD